MIKKEKYRSDAYKSKSINCFRKWIRFTLWFKEFLQRFLYYVITQKYTNYFSSDSEEASDRNEAIEKAFADSVNYVGYGEFILTLFTLKETLR